MRPGAWEYMWTAVVWAAVSACSTDGGSGQTPPGDAPNIGPACETWPRMCSILDTADVVAATSVDVSPYAAAETQDRCEWAFGPEGAEVAVEYICNYSIDDARNNFDYDRRFSIAQGAEDVAVGDQAFFVYSTTQDLPSGGLRGRQGLVGLNVGFKQGGLTKEAALGACTKLAETAFAGFPTELTSFE